MWDSPRLVSLAVTPANPSFALGTTQPFVATGTYSDGSTLDLTSSATWTTADNTIATVNAQGLVSSVALGSTSVTATSASISGSTTLTVTPALLVSIAVTPAIPTIPLGTTQPFTATGTYTDSSTQNITGTVQWSSDTPSSGDHQQCDRFSGGGQQCGGRRRGDDHGHCRFGERIDHAQRDLGSAGVAGDLAADAHAGAGNHTVSSRRPAPSPTAARRT